MDLNVILSRVGISTSMTQDVTLLLVVVLASFIFGMFIGRYRLVTVLINIYVAFALLHVVPDGYLTTTAAMLLFFFVLLIILTLFDKKIFEISISGSGPDFLWRVFGVSFLEIALLASITLSVMPKKEALMLVSKNAYFYLASPNAQLFWMALPLLAIFFMHKRLNR